MANPPTNNLLIPGKNDSQAHPGYKKDMQIIETFMRQPIQKLIAGVGVTLTPASGLATDASGNGPNGVVISATNAGAYASLTGPGETTTPGKLTQAGAFEIDMGTLGHSTDIFNVTFAGNQRIVVDSTNTDIYGPNGVINTEYLELTNHNAYLHAFTLVNINSDTDVRITVGANIYFQAQAGAAVMGYSGGKIGFYGGGGVVKPTVTGSKGGNAALASLLSALAAQGLIIDSST